MKSDDNDSRALKAAKQDGIDTKSLLKLSPGAQHASFLSCSYFTDIQTTVVAFPFFLFPVA